MADGCPFTRFNMASIIFFSGRVKPFLAHEATGLTLAGGGGAGVTTGLGSFGGLRINFDG